MQISKPGYYLCCAQKVLTHPETSLIWYTYYIDENEPKYTSPEVETPQFRFAEGWHEILEAPDAIDYQTWLNDLTELSQQQINEVGTSEKINEKTLLVAWLKALEQVADIVIDPEEMERMTQAEIVETALLTLQTNLEVMGWDTEGLVFTVPNMLTGEEATIDVRELVE